MTTMRSEYTANQALAHQPGRRETVSAVQPETTVFNLFSDNVLINALALAGSVGLSVAVITVSTFNFFA